MANHRAWRVKYDSVGDNGRGCCVCNELQFHSGVGGPDLTDGAPGNQIFNSDSQYSSGGAFDNNNGTYWHDTCTTGGKGWIGWDFGTDTANWPDVKTFTFTSRGNGYGYYDSPNQGGLEWSDDLVTWTRSYSFQKSWGDNQTQTIEAPPPPVPNAIDVTYTKDFSNFTVPAGATTLYVKMWGAAGNGGQYGGGRWGGGGAAIRVSLPVNAGDVVTLQIGGGGDNWNGDSNRGGRGGWPDGGGGARGDVRAGGGGGSSRLFINGQLMAVAGAGGGAAGYACWGGGGGLGNSNAGTQSSCGSGSGGTQTAPGGPSWGWKIGRGIADAGYLGRTGGWGGYMLGNTGDDGAGGGGGYFGGGGGGGDANAGGGGSSWISPSIVDQAIFNGGAPDPGYTSDPDYPGAPIARGTPSNTTDEPAGNGFAKIGLDAGMLVAGGKRPVVPWVYAMDRTPDNYEENWRNTTNRFRIDPVVYQAYGDKIRLCFRGAGSGTRIGKCYVGLASDLSVNSGLDFVGDPIQVFFGGEEYIAIPTDQLRVSDPIDFPIDGTTPLLVSMWFDDLGPSQMFWGPGYEFPSGWQPGNFANQNTSWQGSARGRNYLESLQVSYDADEQEGGGTGERRRYSIIVN